MYTKLTSMILGSEPNARRKIREATMLSNCAATTVSLHALLKCKKVYHEKEQCNPFLKTPDRPEDDQMQNMQPRFLLP